MHLLRIHRFVSHLLVVAFCLLWHAQLVSGQAGPIGLFEADALAELYVNGKFISIDRTVSVLPINGVRQIGAGLVPARPLRLSSDLNAGDVIAIRVYGQSSPIVPFVDLTGATRYYNRSTVFIMSLEDGTMTTAEWRCVTEPGADHVLDWMMQNSLNSTAWPNAMVVDPSCCPWRDRNKTWEHFNAQWIAPAQDPNTVGPTEFYCRYTVPQGSRLPKNETTYDSQELSPALTIASVDVSISVILFQLFVSSACNVYCGVIDKRFFMRAPTSLELKRWGTSAPAVPTEMTYKLVGVPNDPQDFNTTVLQRILVASDDGTGLGILQCQAACSNLPGCQGLTYVNTGYEDIINADTNCKLVTGLNPNTARVNRSGTGTFTSYIGVPVPYKNTLTIAGKLYPGTFYRTFCTTEDVLTGSLSSWQEVQMTNRTEKTAGCFNCGITQPPSVVLLGGFATSTTIVPIIQSNDLVTIYCSAAPVPSDSLGVNETINEIRSSGNTQLLLLANSSVMVNIALLQPSTLYQVSCFAENGAGVASTYDYVNATRRLWMTEAADPPISFMSIMPETALLLTGPTITLNWGIQLSATGLVYCSYYDDAKVRPDQGMVPTSKDLQNVAQRVQVPDPSNPVTGVFTRLDITKSWSAYCTAVGQNLANVSGGAAVSTDSAAPQTYVTQVTVDYDQVKVQMFVDRGPAQVFCAVFKWIRRPTTARPAVPSQATMQASPFKQIVLPKTGGFTSVIIYNMDTGTSFDVYCYSETYSLPTDGIQPPPIGMGFFSIQKTRTYVLTKGPLYNNMGWPCVSGQVCNITGLTGVNLSPKDKVMLRSDGCPGRCKCNGVEDVDHKGAACSAISQDRVIIAGAGIDDRKDPKGAWCYVDKGLCPDEQPSLTFPSLLISYTVCRYNDTAGLPGTGIPGFPNGGIGYQMEKYPVGSAYGWGSDVVVAAGYPYSICWCNGTESSCIKQQDFRYTIGLLHFAGPSSKQMMSTEECISGLPCTITQFDGHALVNGSRLVALPADPRGCFYRRNNAAEPPGIPGFPNLGVSETATDGGFTISWGQAPMSSAGGNYTLCWCGPAAPTTIIAEGNFYRMPDGIRYPDCPPVRPDSAAPFLTPAGFLQVRGPEPGASVGPCNVGSDCLVANVQGVDLRGSDRVALLKTCGEEVEAPDIWNFRSTDFPEGTWVDGGWRKWATTDGIPSDAWDTMGAMDNIQAATETETSTSAPADPNSTGWTTEAPTSYSTLAPRGAWGVPYNGASIFDARIGYYQWGSPLWPVVGLYSVCWCGGVAILRNCSDPKDFRSSIGVLDMVGPLVLPYASQVFRCVRGWKCQILNFNGTMPGGSKLLISSGPCGLSKTPQGVPQSGISAPSPDGHYFDWGDTPVWAAPRMYRLCWCPLGPVGCDGERAFTNFAGLVQVKAPTATAAPYHCPLAEYCNITGVGGEGVSFQDQVMVLVTCGTGTSPNIFQSGSVSVSTHDSGNTYTLPPAAGGGTYRVCWCPGEQVCIRGADFFVDLGIITIGGPDASAIYTCYRWTACNIQNFTGLDLSDGDRLLVVPDGTNCGQLRTLPVIQGWSQNGISNPATMNGTSLSFGAGLVTAQPAGYGLCWCSSARTPGGCSATGPFPFFGGALRLAPAVEYQFLTRPTDPPSRGALDVPIVYLLAIPLPLLFAIAIGLGVKKILTRRYVYDPEAPPLFVNSRDVALRAANQQIRDKNDVKTVFDGRKEVDHILQKTSVTRGHPKEGTATLVHLPYPSMKVAPEPDMSDAVVEELQKVGKETWRTSFTRSFLMDGRMESPTERNAHRDHHAETTTEIETHVTDAERWAAWASALKEGEEPPPPDISLERFNLDRLKQNSRLQKILDLEPG